MRSNRRSASLVAAVVGAFILALTQPLVASAAPQANTNHILSVSSGTVRVFASVSQTLTVTGTAATVPLVKNVAKTFYVNNGGSLTVSRFVMTLSLPNGSSVATFKRCPVNVAFTGANTCASGSPTTLAIPSSGVATNYLISLPGQGFYSFQIVQNKGGNMTVNTSSNLSFVSNVVNNS